MMDEPLLAHVNIVDGGQSQMSALHNGEMNDVATSSMSTFDIHSIDAGVSDPILCGLNSSRGSSVFLMPMENSHPLFSPVKDKNFDMPAQSYRVLSLPNGQIPISPGVRIQPNSTYTLVAAPSKDVCHMQPVVEHCQTASQKVVPAKRKRTLPHPTKKTPQRPTSAYLMYCKGERPSFTTQHENMTSSEVTRILGTQWSRMRDNDSIKKKYMDLAIEDKQRYMEEMARYKESNEYKLSQLKTEQDGLLYCEDCELHFGSEHNKSEHMISSKHQKKVVGKFEKFWTQFRKSKCDRPCCNSPQNKEDTALFGGHLGSITDEIDSVFSRQELELEELRINVERMRKENELLRNNCKEKEEIYLEASDLSNRMLYDNKNCEVILMRLHSLQSIFEDRE